MKTLYPKCLEDDAEYGNTTRGYILPCCWLDIPDLTTSGYSDLIKEKFKLSNVQSIQEVVESEEWTAFYNNLKNNIAPDYCYSICGKSGKLYDTK